MIWKPDYQRLCKRLKTRAPPIDLLGQAMLAQALTCGQQLFQVVQKNQAVLSRIAGFG
ncbi:MAG: hypothetical protein ACRD82_00755 [Blastocatellia bacterium]